MKENRKKFGRIKLLNLTRLKPKQKVRIKWETEGDESRKMFHCIISWNKNGNRINGLIIDGSVVGEVDIFFPLSLMRMIW